MMSEIPFRATEPIPQGVCIAPAANGLGVEVASDPTKPILGIAGLAADEGAEVDIRTPNDGYGPIQAVFGGTIAVADIGKPLTTDADGRCILASVGADDIYTVGTAAGTAGAGLVGNGPNGRVYVQHGVLLGSGDT